MLLLTLMNDVDAGASGRKNMMGMRCTTSTPWMVLSGGHCLQVQGTLDGQLTANKAGGRGPLLPAQFACWAWWGSKHRRHAELSQTHPSWLTESIV